MYTSFTTLVESGDRYALVMQAPVLGSFVGSLLLICSYPFYFAYDAQYYQGQGSCKGTYAQQLANTYGYTCAEVACTTISHMDYITTILRALSRVQWDTANCVH